MPDPQPAAKTGPAPTPANKDTQAYQADPTPHGDQLVVENMCNQWEQARLVGQMVEPERLCRDRPDLLPALRQAIKARVGLDELLAATEGLDRPAPPPTSQTTGLKNVLRITKRYELRKEIARGGMGVVFSARDRYLRRDVAVKILLETAAHRAEASRRFLDEAQIAGQLQHPGIPPVHDLGMLPDGRLFMAMKLIKGRTLAAVLAERATGTAGPDLVGIFLQVAQAVGYAHSKGVIHRDLKPSNVMVGAFGEVQVMDWGVAKLMAAASESGGAASATATRVASMLEIDIGDETKTRAGTVLGTPAYMPPEQADGRLAEVDARTDVFALGAILCELLTGKAPYTGGRVEVFSDALFGNLEPAYARLEACGGERELIDLARRCLSAARDGRPENGREVAAVVATYRGQIEVQLRAIEVARAKSEVELVAGKKRRRLWAGLSASLLTTLAVVGLGAWYVQKQQTDLERADGLRERERLADANALAVQHEHVIVHADRTIEELPDLYRRGLWDDAKRSLDRAEKLAASTADAVVNDKLAGAKAELEFVRQLDLARTDKAVRFESEYLGESLALPMYEAAFAANGFDILGGNLEEQAKKIKASPVREFLLAALDDWGLTDPEADHRDRIFRTSALATGQPWRTTISAAWNTSDDLDQVFQKVPRAERSPAMIAGIGFRLFQLGRGNAGVAVLEEGVRAYPSDFWLHFWLGAPRRTSANPEELLGACRAALAVRPTSAATWRNMGYIYWRIKNDTPRARRAYEEAIRLQPDSAWLYNALGGVLWESGENAAAAEAYGRAVKLHPGGPDNMRNYNGQGLGFLRDKQYEAAIPPLEAGVRLDPTPIYLFNNLNISYEGLGRTEAAAAARAMMAIASRPGLSYVPTVAATRAVVDQHPKYAPAWIHYGNALTRGGKYAEAAEAYRGAVRLDAESPYAHTQLAQALRLADDLDAAVRACQQALKLEPRFYPAYQQLGLVYEKQGDAKAAVAAYADALKIEPRLESLRQKIKSLKPQ